MGRLSENHRKRCYFFRSPRVISLILLSFFALPIPAVASDPAADFRDQYLLNTKIGMFLNNYYYNYSPFAAQPLSAKTVGNQLIIAGLNPAEKQSRYLPGLINNTSYAGHYILPARTRQELITFLRKSRGKAALCILPTEWFEEANRFFPASRTITYSRNPKPDTSAPAHLKIPYTIRIFQENVHTVLTKDNPNAALKYLAKPGLNIIFNILSNIRGGLSFLLFIFLMAVGYLILCRIRLMSEKTAFISTIGISLMAGLGALYFWYFSSPDTIKTESLKTIAARIVKTESLDWKDIKKLHAAVISSRKNQRMFRRLATGIPIKEKLRQGIQDPDKRTRMYSLRTVSFLRNADLFPLIKDAALNDPVINVRYSAVYALGQIRERRALNLLIQIIKDNKDFYTVIQYALPAVKNYGLTYHQITRKPLQN